MSVALIGIGEILKYLPHRYPFLLVDRVVEYVPDTSLTALKNVTVNEPHFQGHFPELPVMPGVLMLEALAQTGGLLVFQSTPKEELEGKIFVFTGIDKVRFRRTVVPGDQILLTVSDMRRKLALWRMHGVAKVNGKVVCEAELTAAMVDKSSLNI